MSAIPDPKPGTKAAIVLGCSCPMMDNHFGAGRYGNGKTYGWFIADSCPLHDTSDSETDVK